MTDWPQYENGANVLALPQVVSILSQFVEHPKVLIEVLYPGGDAGRLWAESIVNWLVSFGVPLAYIESFAGSGSADQIALAVIDRR